MPTNVADVIRDRFIRHEANLLRLEASERRQVLTELNRLERRLRAQLSRHVPPEGLTTVTRRRTEALFRQVQSQIERTYRIITRDSRSRMGDFAKYEAEFVTTATNAAIQVPLLAVGISDATVDALLSDNIVLGEPMRAWWEKQAVTTTANFRSTIRQGLFAGETIDQLTRRVRGTRANNFTDGLMGISRRGAETVTRTAMQSVRNEARHQIIQRNQNVLRGRQVLVTLDTRTSSICIARSGFAWDFDGKPLNSRTTISFPGPPPWHPNCRSTLIPLTKSYSDLVDDPDISSRIKSRLDRLPARTQSSLNGYVASDLSYPQWLREQPASIQRRVLGPGRQKLFSEGKLSLRDLIDETGRPLSLEQLRRLPD